MPSKRFFRYLAPNLITLSSMVFGLYSLWSSHHGHFSLAAWMIVYAVLTDRLDGLVARAVKGTSELGMQLDSFADSINFGIAPAFLILTYLSGRPDLPYHDGSGAHTLLFIICSGYMICAVFRLARYNILSDDQVPTKIFFGFPTTLSGGMLAIWILLFLKYDPTTSPSFGGAKLFGDSFQTPAAVWTYFPIAVAVFGYLMASRLPMPKVGVTKNRVASAILFVLITIGYICGFLMRYPEVLFWMPTGWCIMFLVWGQASASARAMYPPPLFPRTQPERPLSRPQEDLVDIVLDEDPAASASGSAAVGAPGTSAASTPPTPSATAKPEPE
jgi:CDP-diacylglycerol---serine O-phosphatidyltransferase